MGTEAVRFLIVWVAGWINSRQLEVIDSLREENRVLREQLGGRQLRFTERPAATPGHQGPGRRRLGEFAGLVTPDTILRWYRPTRRPRSTTEVANTVGADRAPESTSLR